ncbi:RecB family exonuclease [Segniliparus rugosus]|uniref:PD-(D/E)XK endonuclease-like domain-containing protein n=1 Tax=Segniliparus rugosus (strain ATCC BAA-974 / DSM 45345 / CCUG 50838 / CIP 108380 / JCM 13579 / CDC 945) TaxID=679197 RepID=E5XRU8_SEGRC|nr:PD-(D/E)XK nuclease family protein [Segniliparus rugosus]EFV12963.1 hypothetical protein HMPREF9336_02220 [Segniliparus rugosus ATCC BAA-974]
MTHAAKRTLSVSQYKTYERCPYSWYLSRVEKAWQRPAAWLPQGSAVHEAAEAYERSGRTLTLDQAQDVYRESYARHVGEYCEITPNFNWWFRSGSYGGKEDLERRFKLGLEQVGRYLDYYETHPAEVIWIAPDGTPGIELEFNIDLDGVAVRGFIDAVIPNGCGDEVLVRDNKTGNSPGDDFQLGTYGVALSEQFGVFAPVGDYWMGRTGKPTKAYDISKWTVERVTEEFHRLADNIEAERFDPDPEPSKCMFCDVAYSCDYAVG